MLMLLSGVSSVRAHMFWCVGVCVRVCVFRPVVGRRAQNQILKCHVLLGPQERICDLKPRRFKAKCEGNDKILILFSRVSSVRARVCLCVGVCVPACACSAPLGAAGPQIKY